ncbi:short-chain dehydrogenase/reductase [Malaciobacter marinus]|uniref:Short-chain dehydrogenase n=1 Tax=Malaciobacter marinus TaxID=505249 RepID=A0A347TLM2_9BACT|nr:SDR family NAD(P)-dependent oxidoreductase [Malaciobacter marinus]AXX87500.1 short-chain dehydrogenase/reductase [Malaciobacter marinus]PHO16163.1 short-chain dehydrogenase [Malaciobacter marinus]
MENILITGCSTGIGFETAKVLKNHGFKVYATARKEKDVEILKNLGFISYKLDITKPENIKDILDKILKEDGKLSAVFNNAGYGQPGAVEDVKTEVLKEQFETNLFGLHEMTIQTMKIFRKQGFGKIIQHSSVLGIISLKFRGAYNSSKYAIEGLTDTLRQELIGSNISVSLINTGPVTSKFRENALKMFNKNIIIEDSFFESTYKNEVKKRLESTDDTKAPFNLPATSVANVVLKIMNSKKPKPRYYVTKATHILGFAKRVLSTNLLDKLLNRV